MSFFFVYVIYFSYFCSRIYFYAKIKAMKLVFASNNAHKLDEVRAIMPAEVQILSLHDIGFEQEIEENGTTLEANSKIKADTVYQWLRVTGYGLPVDGIFADDTGLEIDALNGQPGVYTARWYRLNDGMSAAAPLNDEMMIFAANRAKALQELKGETNRGAQFRTVITLIRLSAEPSVVQVEGVVRGRIATEEYGQSGFGYDPVFIPEGYDKTFGELPAEIKNGISHRARALQALVQIL
jgi:XTP/dITP diphosphohydrolase